MRRRPGRLLPVLVLALPWACRRSSDPAILTLGDQVVRRSDFERHVRELESQGGSPVEVSVREALLQSFLEERVLVLEARRRGLLPPGSSPDSESTAVKRMLGEEVLSKVEVTDEETSGYYHDHAGEFRIPERVTLRQILVATEAEARDVLHRIQRDPKSFESLARTRSKSPEAGAGGLMGVFSRGELPAELEAAAFGLPAGGSGIVKTGLGFHVLKVDARDSARDAPLEECRGKIREILRRQKSDLSVRRFVRELMARAKVNHEAADPRRES